jgi:hypothetical protein
MKPVAWMVGAGLVSWLAATLAFGARIGAAALLGVAGPLVVAVTTWLLAERTYRRDPEALTGMMIAAFFGKMVFFGAYVAVMIKGLSQPAVPFAVSFTGSFIALHLIEALALRRLFGADGR